MPTSFSGINRVAVVSQMNEMRKQENKALQAAHLLWVECVRLRQCVREKENEIEAVRYYWRNRVLESQTRSGRILKLANVSNVIVLLSFKLFYSERLMMKRGVAILHIVLSGLAFVSFYVLIIILIRFPTMAISTRISRKRSTVDIDTLDLDVDNSRHSLFYCSHCLEKVSKTTIYNHSSQYFQKETMSWTLQETLRSSASDQHHHLNCCLNLYYDWHY